MYMPNLSAAGMQRFDVSSSGEVISPDGFPPKLENRPLLPALSFLVNPLSPMAKLDSVGRTEQKWNYELPPMEVTALIINSYHIRGAAPVDNFPFALRAIGPVDPGKIMRGGRGLVTEDFVIVP